VSNESTVKMLDAPTVRQTTEYDKFLRAPWNRSLVDRRASVMAEMPTTLRFSPILVQPHENGEGLVILDGQHRFAASKKAEQPVYYIVDANREIEPEMVIDLNRNQSSWSEEDYIDFWSYWEVPSYVYTRDLMNKYDLGVAELRGIFAVGASNYSHGDLQSGDLKIYDAAKIEEFIGFRNSMSCVGEHYQFSAFTRALAALWICPLVENSRLKKRIQKYSERAEKRASKEAQLRVLLETYNYRTDLNNQVGYKELVRENKKMNLSDRESRKAREPEYHGREGSSIRAAAE